MPAKLKTVTLGCKVNQYETEFVREGLSRIGFIDAGPEEEADLCIVNTCTVTNEGDSKSRQTIRRLNRKNPNARIIVMGCYATRAPQEVQSLPGVAEVVEDKRELSDLLSRFGVVDLPTGISGIRGRSRAYVKVQDGCLLKCSFCIIPKVRPEMYSRPMQDVLTEIRGMIDSGVKEFVLTGIHLGHYGVDFNRDKPREDWVRLARLLRSIAQMPGEFRVRLSSIEATEVTRELLETMGEFADKICPHLHISMQSGSDSVLRRMRRRWGSKRFVDRCRLVKEILDRPAITTDAIVGFPGESDREFEETVEVCREVGFSKIHIFPFSPRKGTPAAEMLDQIPKGTKSARGQYLADVEASLRDAYYRELVGSSLRVLVESSQAESNGRVAGTSCRYAPVEFDGSTASAGDLVVVTANESTAEKILGRLAL